jgi:hypothetical protein
MEMLKKQYEPLSKCLCTNTWIKFIKAQGWDTEGLDQGIDYDEEYMIDMDRCGHPSEMSQAEA